MQELKLTDQNRAIGGISHQSIGMRGRAVSEDTTVLKVTVLYTSSSSSSSTNFIATQVLKKTRAAVCHVLH